MGGALRRLPHAGVRRYLAAAPGWNHNDARRGSQFVHGRGNPGGRMRATSWARGTRADGLGVRDTDEAVALQPGDALESGCPAPPPRIRSTKPLPSAGISALRTEGVGNRADAPGAASQVSARPPATGSTRPVQAGGYGAGNPPADGVSCKGSLRQSLGATERCRLTVRSSGT